MGQARLPLAVRGRPASCSESAAAQHMAWCQSKPALPTARGREARTPVETTVARKRLEEMRDDLDRTISVLQGERPGPVAGTGYPADSGDAGSILSEADRTEAILLSARDQRDGVLAALSRIDEASYGQCVDCGHAIPAGRLDARPDAARCVGCQSKWAKRHR